MKMANAGSDLLPRACVSRRASPCAADAGARTVAFCGCGAKTTTIKTA